MFVNFLWSLCGVTLYVIGVSLNLLQIVKVFSLFGVVVRECPFSIFHVLIFFVCFFEMGSFEAYQVNVYSKIILIDRYEMRSNLCLRKDKLGGDIWCVMGNFNYVLPWRKVKGSRFF